MRGKAQSGKQKAKRFLIENFVLLAFCFQLFHCGRPEKGETSVKFQQYYNQGELLYQKHCANCHQKNGKGLGRLYPPLDNSDYLKTNFNDVLCLIRYGKNGELLVNGVSYNQPMPGVGSLTDLEIAEIATYIYNSWSNEQGLISVQEVTEVQKTCE